ncbi:MAG: hypothetical protein KJ737_11645 [Proteobacteria bacterium]|nr:hypothetical protein [Pseudomonadota bacterium]
METHIHRFQVGQHSKELLDRFLSVRDAIYKDNYYYYAENDTHRLILEYYAKRPDYTFECLLAENKGRDIARVLVGRCDAYSFGIFGFFECENNPYVFNQIMEEAFKVSREQGSREIFGPIDLNAFHNWQFLTQSITSERWIGDPYHQSFYPDLFFNAGWGKGESSFSGVIKPDHHETLMKIYPAVREEIEKQGIVIVNLNDIAIDDFMKPVYNLICTNFSAEDHRLAPVDYDVFEFQTRNLLSYMTDPNSLWLYYRDDELVGFLSNYHNFIDRVCNPDNQKKKPEGNEKNQPVFATKTVAVDRNFRGGALFKAIVMGISDYSMRTYGHPLAWRRSNIKHDYIRKLSGMSEITQRYITFKRPLV